MKTSLKIKPKYRIGDKVSYKNPDHRFSDVHIGRIVEIIYNDTKDHSGVIFSYWVSSTGSRYFGGKVPETDIFGIAKNEK